MTEFAISTEAMSSWLLRRSCQYVSASTSPSSLTMRASLYTSCASPISRSRISSLSSSQRSSWSASATKSAAAGASDIALSKFR